METLDKVFLAGAVRESVDSVFSTMLEINLEEAGTDAAELDPDGGIVSLVGITGTWSGTGSLSCSPTLAGLMSARLLMTDPPSSEDGSVVITDEIMDAIAEISNMVVGNIKNLLEEQLGPMAISVPTVIYGRNFQLRSLTGVSGMKTSFLYEGERVDVRISITQEKQGQVRVRPDQSVAA